jgi:hypothetical protein
MQSTNDVFTNAFQLLASTVREFHINGRACLGATLKPRLYQQQFDEKSLGFKKFGDFLRAAQAGGYVKLTNTIGGDIAISPGSSSWNLETSPPPAAGSVAPTTAPPITTSSATPIRVRQDLWNAFNSLADNWVYDPATDSAFRGSNLAPPRPNTIPIPSGREHVTEWMRAFANEQDADVKVQLSDLIDRNAGLYQFNSLTRSKGLLRTWSHFHVQNVLTAIEAWAASNNLQPKNVASPFHSSVPSSLREEVTGRGRSPIPRAASPEVTPIALTTSAVLNPRLESLIDNLIDELISLRGLLQVIGSRRS